MSSARTLCRDILAALISGVMFSPAAAGATTVQTVETLIEVATTALADQSTAALMADMYRKHQDLRLTKIEALRQAQTTLQAQAKYSHPYYWAPFILMGNWK